MLPRYWLLPVVLSLFCLPVSAGSLNDPLVFPESGAINPNAPDDPVWQEQVEIELPPAPIEKKLIAINFDRMGSRRYFIDADSLTVGKDGVVRYTLLAVGSGGARNVSYEGMDCNKGQVKLYAFGGEDGSWSRNARAEWRPVAIRQPNSIQRELFQRYFCHPDIARKPSNFRRLLSNGGRD